MYNEHQCYSFLWHEAQCVCSDIRVNDITTSFVTCTWNFKKC